MMRLHLLVLLLGTTVAAQSRSPLELATAPVPDGAVRLAYGNDPQQFGELRVPAGTGPHPVAIVIHGGCWAAELGSMDPRAIAIDNMRPMAAALTEAGIATWNVEYRRLGNGGGWPAMFQDIARAADFLRTIADAHRLDLTRVVATGHSAGGQLAAWLAMRHRLPATSELHAANPLKLIGVANLDGPVDPARMHPLQERVCGRPVITELMGGAPSDQPDRYRNTSPETVLPLGVPQIIFTGRVFGEQAQAYQAAATQAGDRVEAIVDPNASHFVFIDPQSGAWPGVLQGIQRLLSPRIRAPQAAAAAIPEPSMQETVYTLGVWNVKPGQEAEFVAAWRALGEVFAGLPRPPGPGTLIQSLSDPLLFYSFGPWSRMEDVEAMRGDARAQAAIQRLVALCTSATPGAFRVVAEVPSGR